jgi:lysozyme
VPKIEPMEGTERASMSTGKKGALALLLGTVGGASLLFSEIPKDEGIVLRGYLDPAGIPTKCMGDTYDVVVGKRYTREECEASMEKQLIAHAKPVIACAPQIKGNTYVTYAAVSYAYNAGPGRFCRDWRNKAGKVIYRAAGPLFAAGKWREGCLALGKPVTSRGKVYPGLVKRRAKEVEICLRGLS